MGRLCSRSSARKVLKVSAWCAVLAAPSAAGCSRDAECGTAACAADSTPDCSSSVCSLPYGRCVCPGASVLRRSGLGCEPAAPAASTCTASHRAVVVVGMWAGPELNVSSVTDQDSPFSTVLRQSVAAALNVAAGEVAVSDVRRTTADKRDIAALGMPSTSDVVLFDWALSFCSSLGAVNIDPYDFEYEFSRKAQSYEAFAFATLRLLHAPESMATTSRRGPFPNPTPAPAAAGPEEEGGGQGLRGLIKQYWWMPWVGSAAVLCCICGLFVLIHFRLARSRRRRAKQSDSLQEHVMGPGDARLCRFVPVVAVQGAGGAADEAFSLAPRLAQVVEKFAVAADASGSGYIDLKVGELVEVMAAGEGWCLGSACAEPERVGFFAERCVVWLDDLEAARTAADALEDGSNIIAVGAGLKVRATADGNTQQDPSKSTLSPSSAFASTHIATQLDIAAIAERGPLPQKAEHRAADGAEGSPLRNVAAPASPLVPLTELAPSGPVVRMLQPFQPEEVQDDASGLRSHCLRLDGSELVEVLGAGGGWLYGRVVRTNREGYFPEDRAEWNREVNFANVGS